MAEIVQVRAEEYMREAREGHLSKSEMADALDITSRRRFLDACAAIERNLTEACGTSGDPCLESGCSIDREAGEVCLQPILNADVEYQKACAQEWLKLFEDPRNRADEWRAH